MSAPVAPMLRSLAAFREQQKAVRVLEVQRVLAENTQGAKCYGPSRYGPCRKETEYIVSTIGSKIGKFYCEDCLEPALRLLLIAPADEYPERERERLEELRKDEARRARDLRRSEHVGCAGWAEKDPDNLCRRPAVALAGYSNHYTAGPDGTSVVEPKRAYCARHIVRFRRSDSAVIVPLSAEPLPRKERAS